jgi:hypothetical protein
MTYTEAEKVAARHFRDHAQAELERRLAAEPPTFRVPHFLAVYRHDCPARNDRSSALVLTEIYQHSPAYNVVISPNGWHLALPVEPGCDEPLHVPDTTIAHVVAGRFGCLHRAGRCRGCGATARSTAIRLVDGWQRPPIRPRAARS